MRRFVAMIILMVICVALVVLGGWIVAQKQVERSKAILPTKAELLLYSDLPERILKPLAEAYEAKYQVRVVVLPITEKQMITLLALPGSEQRGDLVITKEQTLRQAQPESLKSVYIVGSDYVEEQFKSDDGHWVGLWYDPMIFAVWSDFYQHTGKYMTTWTSLAVRGPWRVATPDFVVIPDSIHLLYGLATQYGDEESLRLLYDVGSHGTQYTKIGSSAVRLASLGEVDVGIGRYSDAAGYIESKYPLQLVFPMEGTSYELMGTGILESSQREEEAAELISWLLSEEVAQIMKESGIHFFYTNRDLQKPKDGLGHSLQLIETKMKEEWADKALLDEWIRTVRFRKDET